VRKQKQTHDGAAVTDRGHYQCWNAFATDDFIVRQGALLTGDHPAVRGHPQNFVKAGKPLPDIQLEALRLNSS
jgi:hypothetical protein